MDKKEKSELLQLIERQDEIIAEQIRSNKALEGILKDINCSLDRITDLYE